MMDDAPDFSTWEKAALLQFCEDACKRMQHDQEEIATLKTAVKDAIRAYRELHINHDKEKRNVSN
jgi:uncharacterized protein CbrC (UPF0167 family)